MALAAGQFLSGNDLVTECASDKSIERATCIAYVMGVLDSGVMYDTEYTKVCPPDRMSAHQAAKIVVKYADNNPEQLHFPASILVHNALIKAFPCGS